MSETLIALPVDEIAAVLAEVAEGRRPFTTPRGWDPGDCFNMELDVEGGWKITIFIDVGDLDYIDEATAPDGRTRDEWLVPGDDGCDYWRNPIDLLTPEQSRSLQRIIEATRRPTS